METKWPYNGDKMATKWRSKQRQNGEKRLKKPEKETIKW